MLKIEGIQPDNSVFEYYSYSYSGEFLKPNIIRIHIRAIFLKQNIIRILIRVIFSNRIPLGIFLNALHILLSIDTVHEWAPILDKWAHENLSPHFHFSDDRINQSSEK